MPALRVLRRRIGRGIGPRSTPRAGPDQWSIANRTRQRPWADQGAEPPMDVTDQWLTHSTTTEVRNWLGNRLLTPPMEWGALCLLS